MYSFMDMSNDRLGIDRRCYMDLIEIIIVILIVMWVFGFALSVGGGLIHLLLVIAVILIAVKLIQG